MRTKIGQKIFTDLMRVSKLSLNGIKDTTKTRIQLEAKLLQPVGYKITWPLTSPVSSHLRNARRLQTKMLSWAWSAKMTSKASRTKSINASIKLKRLLKKTMTTKTKKFHPIKNSRCTKKTTKARW